ncbi:ephexin-1 [Hoplias malabaricus]|uniref:ephexin-1 n=1 Tax=Hoplias malabaricus TaxID=27720 RepID=UPI0034637926
MALKPNVHQKPRLPPKPQLQDSWRPSTSRTTVDRVISRIEPGTVKQKALRLNSTHGPRKTPQDNTASIQRSTGTVQEQIQDLTSTRERTGDIQQDGGIETNKDQRTAEENGRSEPDGSEMEESGGMDRLEEVRPASPSCPLQEKHCHCVCHLQRPGMKLMWVPVQLENKMDNRNERSYMSKGSLKRDDGTSFREEKTTPAEPTPSQLKHTGSLKSPTMPQCINCQSFIIHHNPQKLQEPEDLYESVDVLLQSSVPAAVSPSDLEEQPCAEEPLYLELQPSDETTPPPPIPPPRPVPPPRLQPTVRHRQKDRRSTQTVLACMLSPRGGCPPIRCPSTCERPNGAPPTGKPKLEKKKSDGKERQNQKGVKPSQSPRKISSDWMPDSDYEPLYQVYQSKVREAEVQLQSESPSTERLGERLGETLGLQGPRASGDQKGEKLRDVKLWQELPVVKESGILHTLSYSEKQRQECMFEVLTSEASYLRSLRVLTDHFLGSRELNDTLVILDRKSLFSNILQVYEVSERFIHDLLDRVDVSVVISDVCDIIHHHAEKHFSVYTDYVRNQVYQEQTYSRLMQSNRAFCTVMRRLEESSLCQRLPFTSFMLLPFQRITRLKILIQSILKWTPEDSAEEVSASRALATVSEIIREANTQVGQMKQMEELMQVANILEFNKMKAIPVVCKNRTLEKQGELHELSKGGSLFGFRFRFTPVYIFLFNDLLILTTRKSSNPERFVVLDHAHRSLVQVRPGEASGTQLENMFSLTLLENHQGNTCERLLKANTESDLHRWMAAFPSVSVLPEKEEKVYEDWDCPQVQCVQIYVAKQADELSLEPCDIINIIRKTKEGWCEGVRLSDRAKGWFPQESVQEVTNEHQRRRNLREQYRIAMATKTPNHRAEI